MIVFIWYVCTLYVAYMYIVCLPLCRKVSAFVIRHMFNSRILATVLRTITLSRVILIYK